MTNPEPISFLAASRSFAAGKDTPRSLLERYISNIETYEAKVQAFVAMDIPAARAAADQSTERWNANRPLSPIDGMPVGIKDIMETADFATEQGSPLFRGWKTGRDSAAVAALREAGAIVIGKTVTTEFAATEPGKTRNPWDISRTPGGSSSGSAAAVASGMISAALGSQVIGSIIRPASYCGCFGFKPSEGGLNRGGSYDVFSQSCTGILAASLEEAWVVARSISARAGGDPGYPGLSGPMPLPEAKQPRRICKLETEGWATATPAAKQAFEHSLSLLTSLGIEIQGHRESRHVADAEMALAEAGSLSRRINAWETRWPLNTYARDLDRSGLSKGMQDRLAEAESMSLETYQKLLIRRDEIRATFAALSAEFDICLTLSAGDAAPHGLSSTGNPAFAIPSSLLGTPAISLPLLETGGLPLGLQALGFANADAELFSMTSALNSYL